MTTIRPATEEDVELINKLGYSIFAATYKDLLSPEQLVYMQEMMYAPQNIIKQMRELGHKYFLAYREGVPMGYVSVEKQREDLFHLQKIYVVPESQGTGLGRELMFYAFDYVKTVCTVDRCVVELNVNRGNKAQHFYTKMGLHIDRSGDYDIGNGYFMNDYIMAIELDCTK